MTNPCASSPATTRTHFLRRVLTLAAACLALGTLGVSHARAQADLTFSGGLGAPLHLMLNAPVTYVVTTAGAIYNSPYFDFQGAGNFTGPGEVSGSITFTINGGAPNVLNGLYTGLSYGSVASTDVYIDYGFEPGVAVGDTVVLNAGTLTSIQNFDGAPPASGSYPTFLFDGDGNRLSPVYGVSGVPEPSTWATTGLGAGLLGLTLRQRRRAAAARLV